MISAIFEKLGKDLTPSEQLELANWVASLKTGYSGGQIADALGDVPNDTMSALSTIFNLLDGKPSLDDGDLIPIVDSADNWKLKAYSVTGIPSYPARITTDGSYRTVTDGSFRVVNR
jgi:hypothetical protein